MTPGAPITGRQRGRTIVVTGGSNGIGQAFVKRLAAEGADVVICDLADGSEAIDLVEVGTGSAVWLPCDLSDPHSIEAFGAEVERRSLHVDAIVHAAGIYPLRPIEDIGFDEWRRVFAVNIDSLFHLVQKFLPGMRSRGWGRIVGVTSNTFQLGTASLSHYVASKGALIGFIRSLSREIGEIGITVNGISPSITRTKTIEAGPQGAFLEPMSQMQSIKRVAVPEDYPGTLSFLLSDDAAFITGQNISVDGGWTYA
ncbi:SDR family oxidoreductase [Altererythrobacter sp. BO-6]|nr:SDR family oxidoreductase [Altererythrobacter sp. BO-6]